MELQNLKAYSLITKKELADIGSTGYVLKHNKTGARVMLIENEDDNKVFNIAFRTTPVDSTGVPHIIEHTVLCGSEKYPSKDPFVELVKGSMNTFLNAMTYPDKTMFPVASCNDQDFRNLMDVYLDSVFHPNIYRNEMIFRQEGWSYQIENADDPVVVNGVVYNEMKGAYSSPDDVLERKIMNSLFPDTTYGVDSGGDPECIPDLTYEQFLDFHRRYYNQANSYIYLYGKMDFEERLEYLDREYLSTFEPAAGEMGENGPVYSEVGIQKPFAEPASVLTEYPIGENDPLEDNTYLAWNVVAGESSDTRLSNAFAVLDYVLLESPGAPLKMALLDAGIGKDVYGSYDSGIRQPVFSVVAKNANREDEERFRKVIRTTLEKLCEEGLNPKAVEAAVNTMEFRYREADYGGYPKGLIYSIDVCDSWLYADDQPFDYLVQLDDYRFLREQIGTGYYEKLIRMYILENPHASYLTAVPKKGIVRESEKAAAEKLAAFKKTLTDGQIRELIRNTEKLRAFQETPSTPEELEKIPMLKREDLKREVRPFSNVEYLKDGVKLVLHEEQTNGIAYIGLLLDTSGIAVEDYPYLGLLRGVLGEVDTEHYSYDELANEIGRRTGGITTSLSVFPNNEDSSALQAAFGFSVSTLAPEIEFSMDIVREILYTSKLDDEKRLREIIQKAKSRLYAHLIGAGHQTALTRAMSYFSAESLFNDSVNGVGFYQVVADLEKNFEEKKDFIVSKLRSVLDTLLSREGFLVSFTGDKAQAQKILECALPIAAGMKGGVPAGGGQVKTVRGLAFDQKNEGLLTPAKVQYVALAGSYKDAGLEYTGVLNVLRVILNYDYLWTNLRVVGGAYGCGATFSRSGPSAFYSYRDPHLKNTLSVYRKIADYLKEFTADERDMTKYVIGTVSGLDTPLTPRMSGMRSMTAYMNGTTMEMAQQTRNQILDATQEDVRALAPYIEAILGKGALCVVGNEEKIQSEKGIFGSIAAL